MCVLFLSLILYQAFFWLFLAGKADDFDLPSTQVLPTFCLLCKAIVMPKLGRMAVLVIA